MWLWVGKSVLAVVVGVGLGLFYFGGLWWTVRRVMTSSRPNVLILVSFFGRAALTLAVLFLILQMHWALAVGSVAAMILTRVVLVVKLGRLPEITGKRKNGSANGS
ncbi:MAG TPA: ATP synthase subunit I [Planctomycetota bacterium]|nr:ATP synthase subunit I [Planctomycetota bacterium]